jgi:hypothetical protein
MIFFHVAAQHPGVVLRNAAPVLHLVNNGNTGTASPMTRRLVLQDFLP